MSYNPHGQGPEIRGIGTSRGNPVAECASPVSKTREIDSLKEQFAKLAAFSADNFQGVKGIAQRLGFYPPQDDAGPKDPSPPVNNHLDALRHLLRDLERTQQQLSQYVRAIEEFI